MPLSKPTHIKRTIKITYKDGTPPDKHSIKVYHPTPFKTPASRREREVMMTTEVRTKRLPGIIKADELSRIGKGFLYRKNLMVYAKEDFTEQADGSWTTGEGESVTKFDKGVSFDIGDAEYLSQRFNRKELLQELHNADIQQGVSRCFGEDDNAGYWQAYGAVCKQALDIVRANQPKVEVREGQVSIRATKEANDIVDVIGRYTSLRKAGKEYIGRCPFHRDNHPSLQVNQQKQLFYCFSCQRKGDVINFIMQIENLDTKGACLFLDGGYK